jgi:hypothetical protein
MKQSDRKLLGQLLSAGKFDEEIVEFLSQIRQEDTKRMIKEMGTKWALHPANAPKRGNYGI